MASTSVVVSCYNKKDTIARCLESLLAQKNKPDEITVVDDGSTDGSQDILRRYSSFVRVILSSHRGISATKNRGYTESSGDVILFVDGDCVLENNYLVELSRLLSAGDVDCIGGELRALNRGLIARSVEFMQNEVQRKWPFGANVAYTRRALKASGSFSVEMTAGEDAELYLRILKLGFKSRMVPSILARTVNPSNLLRFIVQRFVWGTGFRQLTEKHPETFTRKIRECFASMGSMLVIFAISPLDARLLALSAMMLLYNFIRFVPGTLPIYRRTKDMRACAFIPTLRFLNALCYLFGWSYWTILELLGKKMRMKPFEATSAAIDIVGMPGPSPQSKAP